MPSFASSKTTKRTETASTILEVVGGLIMAAGFGLVRLWLGVAVVGIECIVFGLALSLGAPPAPPDLADGA